MKQGGPEEIGITVRGTCFHGQSGVIGHIALGVILNRLGSRGEFSEFRDRLNHSVPPTSIAFPQFCLDRFKWFHWRKEGASEVFSPTLKDSSI
jgi:hypothetical protein